MRGVLVGSLRYDDSLKHVGAMYDRYRAIQFGEVRARAVLLLLHSACPWVNGTSSILQLAAGCR